MLKLDLHYALYFFSSLLVILGSQVSGQEVDISDFVQSEFTIRCSDRANNLDMDQIEILYSGDLGDAFGPMLTVDVFRTSHERPDQREDTGRSFYRWRDSEGEAKVSVVTFAEQNGTFEILIKVDNTNDSEFSQFSGANGESYITVGQWRFSNVHDLSRIDEPVLIQESITQYGSEISNSVNRTWRQCTMLGADGSYSTLESYLENIE